MGSPEIEAHAVSQGGAGDNMEALLLAGVAVGCAANFAWRGHRRTRPEYRADDATAALLHERGLMWSRAFELAAAEVHSLHRIREGSVA